MIWTIVCLAVIVSFVTWMVASGRIKFDKWDDKNWHNLICCLIVLLVGGFMYRVTDLSTGICVGFGATTSLAVGYLKEYLWDKKWGKGVFSKDDLFADVWGVCVGIVLLIMTIKAFETYKQTHP